MRRLLYAARQVPRRVLPEAITIHSGPTSPPARSGDGACPRRSESLSPAPAKRRRPAWSACSRRPQEAPAGSGPAREPLFPRGRPAARRLRPECFRARACGSGSKSWPMPAPAAEDPSRRSGPARRPPSIRQTWRSRKAGRMKERRKECAAESRAGASLSAGEAGTVKEDGRARSVPVVLEVVPYGLVHLQELVRILLPVVLGHVVGFP